MPSRCSLCVFVTTLAVVVSSSVRGEPSNIVLKKDPTKCLALGGYGTSDGSALRIWECRHGHENQQWIIKGSRMYLYKDPRKCVSLGEGNGENGSIPIEIWECNEDNTNQAWSYELGTSGIRLKRSERTGSEKCIASTGTERGDPIALTDCNGGIGQQWLLGKDTDAYEDVVDWFRQFSAVVGLEVLLTICLVLSCGINVVFFCRRKPLLEKEELMAQAAPTATTIGFQPSDEQV